MALDISYRDYFAQARYGTWITGNGTELNVYSGFGDKLVSSRHFDGSCYGNEDFGVSFEFSGGAMD